MSDKITSEHSEGEMIHQSQPPFLLMKKKYILSPPTFIPSLLLTHTCPPPLVDEAVALSMTKGHNIYWGFVIHPPPLRRRGVLQMFLLQSKSQMVIKKFLYGHFAQFRAYSEIWTGPWGAHRTLKTLIWPTRVGPRALGPCWIRPWKLDIWKVHDTYFQKSMELTH